MTSARVGTFHVARFGDPPDLRTIECAPTDGLLRWLVGADTRPTPTGIAQDHRSIAVIGMWRSMEPAAEGFAAVEALLPWLSNAEDQWHALAVPTRTIGVSNHTLDGSVGTPGWIVDAEQPADDGVISMTTAAFLAPMDDLARVARFFGAQSSLNSEVHHAEGCLWHRPIGPLPGHIFDGMNLSMWADLAAMNAFAYRAGEHRGYVDGHHSAAAGWFDRSSFTRFAVIQSHGESPGFRSWT